MGTNEKSRSEPEDSRDKRESLSSLPLVALSAMGETAPLESAAAVQLMKPVDEDTERSKPRQAENEVDGSMQHAGGCWNHPDKREHNRERSNDFGIDFATPRTSSGLMTDMEKVAYDSEDDL
jgi:hypothetical protein